MDPPAMEADWRSFHFERRTTLEMDPSRTESYIWIHLYSNPITDGFSSNGIRIEVGPSLMESD
eukprot:3608989-Pyramimonas_sp.AAC.1